MSAAAPNGSLPRVRALGYFVMAGFYFYIAQNLSLRAANGLSGGVWTPLVERASLLFLLVVGYAVMGRLLNRQQEPVRAMGLVGRPTWSKEFGLGAALGWAMLLVSILPMVLTGGLYVTVWTAPRQFAILLLDLVLLAIAALAEEVAFRGYPFQRLIEALGPTLATLFLSFVFAGLHFFNPYADRASFWVTVFSSWLLSVAYLRTRALWICWGWHFAWNASMGVLFGLPVSGLTQFSPLIQSKTVGPPWITGGDYGPEGSAVTAFVLLVGIVVVYRTTRGYAHRYAQPVIVAAGIPVDLDAMSPALAPYHPADPYPAAVHPAAPAGTTLVQISGVAPLLPKAATPPRIPSMPEESMPPASSDPKEPPE